MKKTLLLAACLFLATFLFAQNELMVQQGEKGLHLQHTVAPKESFYALGRLYNVAPKEIAAANGLDMNKGLNAGQVLRIPLTASNFSQKGGNGRAIYYQVDQKEGLYRVSVKNNNVQLADLRKWNKLSNDNIAAGQKLIIGYLISPEAAKINPNTPDATSKPEEIVHTEIPVPETKKEEPKKEEVKKEEPRPEVKQEVEKPEPPKETPKKEEPQKVVPKPVNNPATANDSKGGFFKSHFDQQVKASPVKTDETASSGIFKTASGWQDAKYYALIDGVEPGTIIRIVNPTNNRAIYAKVLGQMSGIRQNQGYDIRISNAAASALEIADTEKFIVRINY